MADLTREIPPEDLPPGLDFIFYTTSAGGSDDKAYRKAYVDGPRNLLGALSTRGETVRRFFFTSSTGVYGQSNGEWVDESSPTEPGSFSGRRLLEGEQTVLDGRVSCPPCCGWPASMVPAVPDPSNAPWKFPRTTGRRPTRTASTATTAPGLCGT